MSSKRVRLISLTGAILIVLVIGISLLITLLSNDKRDFSLPEISVSDITPSDIGVSANNGLALVQVTTDNVQNVIATMKRAAAYSRQVIVEVISSGGNAVSEIEVSFSSNNTALVVNSTGVRKHVLVTDSKLYIWYDGDKTSFERNIGEMSADRNYSDAYQKMMTYEDVLAVDKSSITAAGYTMYNNENCIYVQYLSVLLGYSTNCYISLDSGLLVGTEQYAGDVLIYKMTALNFDSTEPDSSVFLLPDGRNPVTDT